MNKTVPVFAFALAIPYVFGQTPAVVGPPAFSLTLTHSGSGGTSSGSSAVSNGYTAKTSSESGEGGLPWTGSGACTSSGSILWTLTVQTTSTTMPAYTTISWIGTRSGYAQSAAIGQTRSAANGAATTDGASNSSTYSPGGGGTTNLTTATSGSVTLITAWVNVGGNTWQATANLADSVSTSSSATGAGSYADGLGETSNTLAISSYALS